MKVYRGKIITVNAQDRICRYLAEDEGKIVFVGDELPERYAAAPLKDVPALIPSFVDTHQHFASFSTFHAGLNVMDAESNAQICEMIRDFAAGCSGKTLIAFGASPYSVSDGRLVSREELDSACADKEVMVVKYDGHACIINSRLLAKLKNKLSPLRGYHPDTGEMNQEAFFRCSDYISNSLSIPQLVASMYRAEEHFAERGIGEIHTVSGVGFPFNADITVEKLFAASHRNGFQIRVFPQSMNVKTAVSRKLPRIGGCFACALDGCFGSHDAALNEPYADAPDDRGVLYYSDEKVAEFCKQANRLGLQIELHAIGDRAFDQACRAIRAALEDYPRQDHRHGIIHCCLPTEEGMDICAKYHIQMPVQSAFIGWKQEPDSYLERILGLERTERLNPLKEFAEHGISVSFGSDAPCTDPDPIQWLDRAVNHSTPGQRINLNTAIRMATYNGYKATFDEKERGSLETGKIADMAVLSTDPFEAKKLTEVKVNGLILNGREYQSSACGLLATLAGGIKEISGF